MEDAKVIYQGYFSGIKKPIMEKSFLSKTSLSQKSACLINLAIPVAKRLKGNIVITMSSSLHIDLYLPLGVFIGSIKIMLMELIGMADNVLFQPINDDPDFALRITLSCDDC